MFRMIRRNDLISRRLKTGERTINKADEVILSELEHPNPLQAEILFLNNFFSFYQFFSGVTERETAIGIITPKQALLIECKLTDVDSHGYNFQALYDGIYDSEVDIIPVRDNTTCWQENVMEDGNIVVQMSKEDDILIWCPSEIDEFQLKALRKLSQSLQDFLVLISTSQHLQDIIFNVHAIVKDGDEGEKSIELISRDLEGNDINNVDEFLKRYESCKKYVYKK